MSKTKELMLDVARQLFARFGVAKTTMNDIADAAHKGRRTIYTYFKSKDEIFEAVIERELNKLYCELEEVYHGGLRPDRKLLAFTYRHLNAMRELVMRNGSLRADFFKDIWTVEEVRKSFDRREQQLIRNILDDGINQRLFNVPDSNMMSRLIQNSMKGLEVPFISGHLRTPGSKEFERLFLNAKFLIFQGICTPEGRRLHEEDQDADIAKI